MDGELTLRWLDWYGAPARFALGDANHLSPGSRSGRATGMITGRRFRGNVDAAREAVASPAVRWWIRVSSEATV